MNAKHLVDPFQLIFSYSTVPPGYGRKTYKRVLVEKRIGAIWRRRPLVACLTKLKLSSA